jgi:hypothetical protein
MDQISDSFDGNHIDILFLKPAQRFA